MTTKPGSSPRYRWIILGVCWLAFIVAFMQRLSIGPLGPFLKEDLDITSTQFGMLMSAAAFGYMITLIPGGWLVDKIGVRRVLLIGEVVGGIFIAAMLSAQTYVAAVTFLGLAGLGMGLLQPSTTKAILLWFPAKERATAMSLKQTAINIGEIITATTLPTIALALSWHYGFLGIGLIGIAIGIMSFMLYKDPPPSAHFDTTQSIPPPKPKSPVREILRGREIWLITIAGTCLMVVEFSVLTYFVLFLFESLSFPEVAAGNLLAVLAAGGAFGKPITGFISDYFFHGSRRIVFILLAGIAGTTCLLFSFTVPSSPSWLIGIMAIILGLSGISWGGLHLTMVGEIAGKESAGLITGISVVFLMMGNLIGPPLFGYIVDISGSYRAGWQFLATLAAAAIVPLLFAQERTRRI